MNIFAVDESPTLAARALADVHVRSQIRETAQMLSTAHHVLDGEKIIGKKSNGHKYVHWIHGPLEGKIYKCTHINHPSTIWCRETSENYAWAFWHMFYLSMEYCRRYGKEEHGTDRLFRYLSIMPDNIPIAKRTPFAQAMPTELQKENGVQAYRDYYKYKLESGAVDMQWRLGGKPEWLN